MDTARYWRVQFRFAKAEKYGLYYYAENWKITSGWKTSITLTVLLFEKPEIKSGNA